MRMIKQCIDDSVALRWIQRTDNPTYQAIHRNIIMCCGEDYPKLMRRRKEFTKEIYIRRGGQYYHWLKPAIGTALTASLADDIWPVAMDAVFQLYTYCCA